MLTFVASLLILTQQALSPDAYRLNRQGKELLEQRRYAAAARAFEKAVDLADSELGAGDPATAMMLRNLALAQVHGGNLAAAEQTAARALSIMEEKFGMSDPALTPILNVLAECYASGGRIADAQRLSERAVSMGSDAGVHYGIALQNLGAIHEYSGDFVVASSFYRKAIAVKSEALGAAHPHVALSKSALRRVDGSQQIAARSGSLKLEQGE